MGTPRLASDAKSPSAIATFWSGVIAASSSSARWPGGWLASRHGSSAAIADPATHIDRITTSATRATHRSMVPLPAGLPPAENLVLARDSVKAARRA